MSIIIHGTRFSPFVRKVFVALEEKGVALDREGFAERMEDQRQRGRARVKDESWGHHASCSNPMVAFRPCRQVSPISCCWLLVWLLWASAFVSRPG